MAKMSAGFRQHLKFYQNCSICDVDHGLGANVGGMAERSKLRWNGWGWANRVEPLAARGEVWTWLASELGMPSLLATPARPLDELALEPSRLTELDRRVLAAILGGGQVREDKYERAFHAR